MRARDGQRQGNEQEPRKCQSYICQKRTTSHACYEDLKSIHTFKKLRSRAHIREAHAADADRGKFGRWNGKAMTTRTLLVPNLQRPATNAVEDRQEALLEGVLEHCCGERLYWCL